MGFLSAWTNLLTNGRKERRTPRLSCIPAVVFLLLPALATAQIHINEFLASNSANITDPQGQNDDWIELYNEGAAPVNVGGMFITDDPQRPTKHMIPTNAPAQTTIPAGGYLILWADSDTGDGPTHLGFGLSAGGESLALYATDGATTVDAVTFGPQATDVSFGRFPDGDPIEWRFYDPPSPGAANTGGYLGRVADTKFDINRGFFAAPFSVTITCATPGAQIYYTTDCSEPTQSSTLYSAPIPINDTTVIKARAYYTGWLPTNIDTQTYIFNNDTLAQSDAGAIADGFPVNWTPSADWGGTIPGDYEMDPDVLTDPAYTGSLTTALTDLPAISVTMPVDSWFGYSNGLISNSQDADAAGWERACAAEMIYPNGQTAFAERCAVRLVGGTSPQIGSTGYKSPKHSFRLKFKDPYGPTRLRTDEPILPGSPLQSINTLVLDARMNMAWHYSGGSTPVQQRVHAQYIRDQYANDIQNTMGDVSPHGFYAHLYINGLYWGMYCVHERPDDAFQSEYWGGDPDEYDVIRHTSGEVIAGTNAGYLAMLAQARSGVSDPTVYNTLITQYLDVDPFINYMIMNFWIGNTDWAHHNWYCGRNRNEPGALFEYYSWDAEHVMEEWDTPPNPLGDNVVGRNNSGGPTEIHQLLKSNSEYWIRFADRAHKLMHNGGLLTEIPASALYDVRVNEIYDAVIMESARWGDRVQDFRDASAPLYTRDDYWIPELDRLRNYYFPDRADTVISQLIGNSAYPTVEAPSYNINAAYQHGGTISSGDLLTIDNPHGAGTVYYTLDGSDPRQPIGASGTPTTLIAAGASKRILVPTSDIGANWYTQIGYDDSAWTLGTGGIGYDDNPDYLPFIDVDVRSEMYGNNTTCYLRIPFTVDAGDLASFASLTLRMMYDDGFIVYLNGNPTPIYQVLPPPGAPTWNSASGGGHEAAGFESFDVTPFLGSLQAGNNFLAVHALNQSLTSSDFLCLVELEASTGGAGGGPSATALTYTPGQQIPLTDTTQVRARVLDGANWSAMNDAVYRIDTSDLRALRITEVMFNPAPGPPASYWDASAYEFVEIKNTGPVTLDLTGVQLTDGVYYEFNDSSVRNDAHLLAPGQHIVVAKNKLAFRSRYGDSVYLAGQYLGSQENSGERIGLMDGATTITEFRYNDAREWPQAADGGGHSLVPLDSTLAGQPLGLGDWGGNWRASTYIGGSPGMDDPAPSGGPTGVVLNEVAAHTDYPTPPPDSNDWIEIYNTTAGDVVLDDCYLSDDVRNLAKWQIPNGTVIGAGSVLSFDEVNDFHNPVGFGLNKDGERVVLSYLPGTAGDRILDEVRFKGQENGVTLGRYTDGLTKTGPGVGSWRPMLPSRDAANTPPIQEPVINQFMYHPDDGSTTTEYIEIHNPTGVSVNLWNAAGRWRISGGVEYVFETDITLPAGGYLLVLPFDPADTTALDAFKLKYGVASLSSQLAGPWKGSLSNGGERIAIEKPQAPDLPLEPNSWVIVDETFYFDKQPYPTSPDGGGNALHRVSDSEPGPDPTNWIDALPNLLHTGIVAPFVANQPASAITDVSATLNGQLTANGGEDPTVWIYWGTTDGGTNTGNWQQNENLGVRSVGAFSAPIASLTPSTVYYFRAYAQNSAGGTWASATASFTTSNPPAVAPTINHSPATNITYDTATLNGTVVDTGGENPLVRFYWGTGDAGKVGALWAQNRTMGYLGAGPFSTNLTGLIPGTTYYFQVYAENSGGAAWAAASGSFATPDLPSVVPPSVTTQAPSNITQNSGRMNGSVTDTGGENPTVYVYWGRTAGGTTPGNWEHAENLGVRGLGGVSFDATGLTASTEYFYRVYAQNSAGGSWANATASFVTSAPPILLPTANVLAASNITHNSATAHGQITSTGGENPSVRVYWGTTDGGTIAANWEHVEWLGQLGTGLFAAPLSGLTPQTFYYYRVLAQNSAGATWTGSVLFLTLEAPSTSSPSRNWHLYR